MIWVGLRGTTRDITGLVNDVPVIGVKGAFDVTDKCQVTKEKRQSV